MLRHSEFFLDPCSLTTVKWLDMMIMMIKWSEDVFWPRSSRLDLGIAGSVFFMCVRNMPVVPDSLYVPLPSMGNLPAGVSAAFTGSCLLIRDDPYGMFKLSKKLVFLSWKENCIEFPNIHASIGCRALWISGIVVIRLGGGGRFK